MRGFHGYVLRIQGTAMPLPPTTEVLRLDASRVDESSYAFPKCRDAMTMV